MFMQVLIERVRRVTQANGYVKCFRNNFMRSVKSVCAGSGNPACKFLSAGLIRFAGRHFTPPSLAAAHAVKRRTCNGWSFSQYERAPGDGVLLNTLRK